ncbi:peptidoglycan DD-metalloendopeptidase family protein [Candidatus Dojkabacteria bacterium]|nr:peptidoglycan DD-metalloendopeptidase family protein [Candidatus Dojkabacteria bacterium]
MNISMWIRKTINRRFAAKVILLLFCAVLIFTAVLLIRSNNTKNNLNGVNFIPHAFAEDITCPETMSDQECLEYLNDKSQQIQTERKDIEQKLDEEMYKQLGITQKINYLNKEILARESKIREIEIELEAKNVEIRIITKEINELQTRIDTLTQEITNLDAEISRRLTKSYKYNYLSPVEMLFSSEDVDTVMRKLKYLAELRKKDHLMLLQLQEKNQTLAAEEDILVHKQREIQEKRDEIKVQKRQLSNEKAMLAGQREEQQELMAESQRLQEEYENKIAKLKARQNEVDTQAITMMMEMFHRGQLGDGTPVSQGQIVGFQGHTGCAYGSHLHFGIYSSDSSKWWVSDINPYDGHLSSSGGYLVSNKATSPQNSAYITQSFHQGYAIDTVSMTDGNQLHSEYGGCWDDDATENQCYYISKGELSCDSGFEGWLSLRGEGAPIFAIYGGKVYYDSSSDIYGGKMALVDHENGMISIYVHLR